MQYSNPQLPEGINVSATHPLAEFGGLLVAVVAIAVAVVGSAYLLAGLLLPYVPYSAERAILDAYDVQSLVEDDLTPQQLQVQRYLQQLTQELVAGLDLPEDLELQVHYFDSEQMNAFATLGGHIVVNRGLLEAVESENGLAMVLGHEIGHVVHRDPLLAMGRATVTLSALALLSGFSQSSVANTLFNLSAEPLMLGFSREQERAADDFGVELLMRHYGHLGGAVEFFRSAQAVQDDALASVTLVEFFSTHPDLEARIVRLEGAADDRAADDSEEPLVGLPVELEITP